MSLYARELEIFRDVVLSSQEANSLRVPDHTSLKRRLDVYRNNREGALVAALQQRYPVTLQLVGEPCFRGIALTHARAHPSAHASLFAYGSGFPATIAQLVKENETLAELPWLVDVARVENFRFELDHPLPGPTQERLRVDTLNAQVLASLRLRSSDGIRLFRTDWNVDEIVRAHDAEAPDQIQLIEAERYLCVTQNQTIVLSGAEFELLKHLKTGSSLADLEQRYTESQWPTVTSLLLGFLNNGWIVRDGEPA